MSGTGTLFRLSGGSEVVAYTRDEAAYLLEALETILEATCPRQPEALERLQSEATFFGDLLYDNVITEDASIQGERVPDLFIDGAWITATDAEDLRQLSRDFVALRENCFFSLVGVVAQGYSFYNPPDEPTEEDISWPDAEGGEWEIDMGEKGNESEIPEDSYDINDERASAGMSTGMKVGLVAAGAAGLILVGTVLLKGK